MTVQRAVSVVLPTYNESESLPVIVPRIVETLRDAGLDGEVIVVDDDSPDGTAEVAHGLAERYPVRVIHRTEDRGLAKAVIAGFAASEAEVCVVMDADGSHPVSALPGMVEMIRGDRADIVVGSRNVEGGGSRNWPLFSQLKSRFAAALTFGLTSMTDPTTGFMAIRRDRVAGLDLDPVGWKIVLETVVKASPARVAEVPIVFEDREYGESKQSLGVFLEYLEHLAKLYAFRYPSLVEFLKFCIVGVAGLTVDLTTVVALKESMGLDTRVCAAFGFTVAVSSNYLLNRLWTFRRARELPWLWSYLTYVGANLLGLSVRMVTVHLLMVLTTLDRGYGYVLSNAAGIALATIFNFLGAKYFAFDPDRLAFGSDALDRDVPSAPVRPALRRAAVALLSAVTLYTAVDSTALRALVTDDEGVNVVTARNIEHSTALLIRPSVYPGGRHDWVSEDMPALGNLPLFPALMSLADRIGGLAGMGLLPWGALCVIVLCTALTLSPHSPRAATYTAVLLGTSPVFLQQARRLEFEPVLTACCAAGMMVFARGTAARRPAVCMAGGALLGLGFLTKMWLVVPYVFAVCGFILVQTTVVRAREQRPLWLRRSVIGGAVGFALVATLHLLFVAAVSPQD
ncbi:MAG: glycosyltransferase family 2 protein, partial [Myxococcales bacterium]